MGRFITLPRGGMSPLEPKGGLRQDFRNPWPRCGVFTVNPTMCSQKYLAFSPPYALHGLAGGTQFPSRPAVPRSYESHASRAGRAFDLRTAGVLASSQPRNPSEKFLP